MKFKTLSKAPKRRAVTVKDIKESPQSIRLTELGILPGVSIMVMQKSPLGNTMYVKLKSSRIALRKDEAEQVLICEPD